MLWKETEYGLSVTLCLLLFGLMLSVELVLIEPKEERDITNTGKWKLEKN